MAPKEGQHRLPKRTAPKVVADVGSAHSAVEEDPQLGKDREIEQLRLEVQRLHAEGTEGRPQSSSTASPAVSAAEQRAAVGERAKRSKVSLRESLRYDTPEFKGERK